MTNIKTATVNVRIQENVKTQAEAILNKLGLSRATAIDLFYRQIIMSNGIPFPLQVKNTPILSREDMTDEEYHGAVYYKHLLNEDESYRFIENVEKYFNNTNKKLIPSEYEKDENFKRTVSFSKQ